MRINKPKGKDADIITLVIGEQTMLGCELLRKLLSDQRSGIRVVGHGTGIEEVLKLSRQHKPNVLLLSASQPEGQEAGIGLVKRMKQEVPQVRVLLLLDRSMRRLVVESLSNGASGIYLRSGSTDMLSKAIRMVNRGDFWVSSQELVYVLEQLNEPTPFVPISVNGDDLLAPRENRVARLVAEGHTNREIAQKLNLSEHTVKNYVFHVFDKLGVSNRVELANYAMRRTSCLSASIQ